MTVRGNGNHYHMSSHSNYHNTSLYCHHILDPSNLNSNRIKPIKPYPFQSSRCVHGLKSTMPAAAAPNPRRRPGAISPDKLMDIDVPMASAAKWSRKTSIKMRSARTAGASPARKSWLDMAVACGEALDVEWSEMLQRVSFHGRFGEGGTWLYQKGKWWGRRARYVSEFEIGG